MSESLTCQDCGAPLAPGAPRNLCPRCLLRAGLAGPSGNVAEHEQRPSTADQGTTTPGVLDALAVSTGVVSRILLRDTDNGFEPPLIRPDKNGGGDSGVRYRIDGEIARGGMGQVLKGRDPDLGRDVALKVLREDFRDDVDMVRRFVEEAQIGGQLQHPGIVPIYELGLFGDRRPFFAMKLVKGDTLAKLLDGRKSPVEALPRFLAIFEAVAQTVAYAHARGVIHRDLKPSNVMVGSFGEVQVMDWGLAKVLPRGGVSDDATAGKVTRHETVIATARSGSDDSDLSRAGSAMGTPSYMSPEQARGEIDRINERADVFALGSILCEILTGQPSFIGRNSGEIQRKAALGDLADAMSRLDSSGADPDLVAIARDCLAREPEDRLRDAGEVLERVTLFMVGVQEKLRRAELASVEERGRRRLTTVVAAALILLGLVGGGGYVVSERQRAERVARTARGVDEALAEAARARGDALGAPAGDLGRWAEAHSAAKRAESLLAQGEADPALAGRVHGALVQLETDRAGATEKARRLEVDRVLLADLEIARGKSTKLNRPEQADAAYNTAFRKAGLDIDATDSVEAGKWLAKRSDPVELAGYLDDWISTRIKAKRPEADWRRLVAVVRASDPDPWRDALRARIAARDPAAAAVFSRLADDDKALDVQPSSSLILLARQLRDGLNDRKRAARVLERAVLRYPGDFWAHVYLSAVWSMPGPTADIFPRPEESVRHLTAALAIRPNSRIASTALGMALIAEDKPEEGIAVFREAIRMDPTDVPLRNELGYTLWETGKVDDAIAELREALRLEPRSHYVHFYLAHALRAKGQMAEAVREYREAIEIEPEPIVLTVLGRVLREQGKLEESAGAHREALRRAPELVNAHYNLSSTLLDQGKLDDAMAESRAALQLNPEFAKADLQRGLILRIQGDYSASLAAYRRGHDLGSKQPLWSQPSAQAVADAERLVSLAPRIPALLKGDDRPGGNAVRLALAQLSFDLKRFATAARFWSDALGADPTLGDDRRAQRLYNAACAALMAAAGKGVDDPPLDDLAKAKLRAQALGWLRAELATWGKLLDSGQAKDRTSVFQNVYPWRISLDLASVRNADALARIPESERQDWHRLWADVDALLERVQAPRR